VNSHLQHLLLHASPEHARRLTTDMASIITRMTDEVKHTLEARLHPLTSTDTPPASSLRHSFKLEHLRSEIPTPAWLSTEVSNAYCDLLRAALTPSAEEEEALPVAVMPLTFFSAISGAAHDLSGRVLLDAQEYSQGITSDNFNAHATIYVPLFHESHFALVVISTADGLIMYFDSFLPTRQTSISTLHEILCMLNRDEEPEAKDPIPLTVVGAWVKNLVGEEEYARYTSLVVNNAPQQASGSGDCGPLVLLELRLLLADDHLEDLGQVKGKEMAALCEDFRYLIMAELVCQKLNPRLADLPPVTLP
jgi:hypothetical protein